MALTYAQFKKVLKEDEDKLRRGVAPEGTATCHICHVPLQEAVTGNRRIRDSGEYRHVCSDCYFEMWGNDTDKHPIGIGRRIRGG